MTQPIPSLSMKILEAICEIGRGLPADQVVEAVAEATADLTLGMVAEDLLTANELSEAYARGNQTATARGILALVAKAQNPKETH